MDNETPSVDRATALIGFKALRGSHPEERRVARLVLAGLYEALEPCTQPLVVGGPGLGKTDLCQRVVDEFVTKTGRRPKAYVNVPPGPQKGQVYDLRPLCRQILRGMGRPAELVGAVGTAVWENERVEQALIETTQEELNLRQPGALILDEMERLLIVGAAQEQPLDTIAWWADRAGVPILGVGNYKALMSMGGSGKLARRQPLIHYEPYEGTKGYENYLEGMLLLVTHLHDTGLAREDLDWDSAGRSMFSASHGRVGESKRVLSFALALAGDAALTSCEIEESIATRLSTRVQRKFESDLADGRERVAGIVSEQNEPAATERRAEGPKARIGRKATIIATGTAGN